MSDAMTHLRETINGLLVTRRPDRYTIGGEDETGWLNQIAVEIEPLIPEVEAKKLLARNLVNQEEGKATRRANDFCKDYLRTGQRPLFLDGVEAWPISVISVSPDDKTKKIEERVALRAVTDADGEAFANEERRRAGKDFAARNATCEGMELIVTRTREAGLTRIWDYIVTEDPPDDPKTA